MLKAISECFGLQSFFDLRTLVRIVSPVLSLGPPPAISDSEGLREWLRKLCEILQDLAVDSPGTSDDGREAMLATVLESDDLWALAHIAIVVLLRVGPLIRTHETEDAITAVGVGFDGPVDRIELDDMLEDVTEILRGWMTMEEEHG